MTLRACWPIRWTDSTAVTPDAVCPRTLAPTFKFSSTVKDVAFL